MEDNYIHEKRTKASLATFGPNSQPALDRVAFQVFILQDFPYQSVTGHK